MFLLTGEDGGFGVSAVLGRDLALASDWPIRRTRRSAVKTSSSVKRPKGSKLLRIVPVKSVGSTHLCVSHNKYRNSIRMG